MKRPENFIILIGVLLAIIVITIGMTNFGKLGNPGSNSPLFDEPTSSVIQPGQYHWAFSSFGDQANAAERVHIPQPFGAQVDTTLANGVRAKSIQ